VVVARFGSLEHNGRPNAFAVLGASGDPCRPDWYRVRFANSADGATGWVAASLVDPYRVRARIVVDLSARRLVLYVSGKQEISAPVAVGAAGTPTPTGRFFVTERWRILDPTGPLGAAALGISAHSSALHGWPRGAPIALHGTNDPASIGRAASHGCVRVDNTVIRRLLGYALLGTPVTIRP
jgi:lipoprotein-anchoring transpeptidase ErfK/SrfK